MISITIISISSVKLKKLAKRRNMPDFSYNGETAETQNESHECNSKPLKTNVALVYIIYQDITRSTKNHRCYIHPQLTKNFVLEIQTNHIQINITNKLERFVDSLPPPRTAMEIPNICPPSHLCGSPLE